MSNPATRNIEAYFGNTYGLVYVFENSTGAAFDIASNFSTLSLKIFTKNNEASPLVELDLDSGFTISDTNRLVGEITAAQNETLFGSPIKYYQMTVTYNGDTETILKGIYVVNRAQSGSANDTALTLTVSLAPLEVSVSIADNAFLALQAKNETQEIVSQVSPSRAGISYATKVDMNNDTTQINGTTGIVANDTATNNGFYRWDGTSWVKRDNFYSSVLNPIDESEAVNGKAVGDYQSENIHRQQSDNFALFSDADLSSVDFDEYELINDGDSIEVEFKVLDNTVNNFGLLGEKLVTATNFIGVDSSNRLRIREDNGNLINSHFLPAGEYLRLKVEVDGLTYKITINDSFVIFETKTDKIIINNLGRSYSSVANSYNGLIRNFSLYKLGELKVSIKEAFSGIGFDKPFNFVGVSKYVTDTPLVFKKYTYTNHVLSYGQSLSLGTSFTGAPVYSKALYNNKTFPGGVRAGTSSGGLLDGAFIDLIEEQSATESTRGETHISTMLNYFTFLTNEFLDNNYFRMFGSTAGNGGTSLVSLSKGTEFYDNLVAQIQAAFDRQNDIYSYLLKHIIWIQGEADYVSSSPSPTYHSRLKALLDDIVTDYKNITKNLNSPNLITTQLASHKYYQYRSEVGGSDVPAASSAWVARELKKSGDTYGDIRCLLPLYILDYVDVKNLHPDSFEYPHIGAYLGKYLYQIEVLEKDVRPITPLTIKKRTDNVTIDAKFHVPYGKLQWDDVNNGGKVTPILDKGFEVWSDGLRVNISSVNIVSNDTVRIVVDSALGASSQLYYGIGSDITDIQIGRTTGPRGQLRDNEGEVYSYISQTGTEHKLDNFCLIFIQDII